MRFFKKLKSLKYKWQSLFWLNVLFSPFKKLTFKVYFGKIQWGIPYFYPRYWRKFTHEDCIRKAEEARNNPNLIPATHNPDHYKGYSKPVPAKWFHFKITHLGWKTKYEDFRFEWSPSISLVILKRQLYIVFFPKSDRSNDILDHYWEAFLEYHYETDKRLSTKARLVQLFEKHSCTWTIGSKVKGNEIRTDYYDYILKQKYVKFYHEVKD